MDVSGTRGREAAICAACFMAGALLLWWIPPFSDLPALARAEAPVHIPLLLIACAAGTWHRARPVLSFAVAGVAVLADALMGLHPALLLAWGTPLYGVARFGSGAARRMVAGVLAVACAAVTAGFLARGLAAPAALGNALMLLLTFAGIPFWWGSEMRGADGLAETARLRHEQDVRAERAVIAEELHDTISAHLSAIAIHAAGALDLPPEEERDRRALGEARRAAVAALADMRALIGVLRSDAGELPRDVPGGSLDEVASSMRAAAARCGHAGVCFACPPCA